MRTVVELDLLDEFQEKAHKRIRQGIADGAVMVQADAQRLAPVDTGRLRSSLATRETGPLSFEMYTNLNYSMYVEAGTRHAPAQPYARPAFEMNRQLIIANLQKSLANL